MRGNLKWLHFGWGIVLLCSLGAVGYGASQADSTSLQPSSPPQTASKAKATPGVSGTTTAEISVTPKASQTLNGFSTDGQHYLHLESWRDTGAGIPQAALQVIDLANNRCVQQGCLQTTYSEAEADLSLQAAENQLLQQTQNLRQTLKLTQPIAGVRLPIRSRSRLADGTETLTVQLSNGQPLQLRLKQTKMTSSSAGGTVENDKTAIVLSTLHQGKERIISNPNQWHDWTLNFSIRDVYQSPDSQRMVVLLTAEKLTFEGTLDRTVIQSLDLQAQ